MRVAHTSETSAGQIYVPSINTMLMVAVLVLMRWAWMASTCATSRALRVTAPSLIYSAALRPPIHAVDCWIDSVEKANQLAAFRAQNAEGVVFKRVWMPRTPRRESEGDHYEGLTSGPWEHSLMRFFH
jgi:hypothetical protein